MCKACNFTKSDLKDGMVVEYRDGTRRMVLGDYLFGFYGNNNLILYTDNLEEKNNEDLTIDKVYRSKCLGLYNYFNDIYLELIWKREKEEPPKEMTIEEIEKELGCKIKIVENKY